MKIVTKKSILPIILLLVSLNLTARNFQQKPIYTQVNTASTVSKFITFDTSENRHNRSESVQVLTEILELDAYDSMASIRTDTDNMGKKHERFQQYFKGVKVQYKWFIVHSKNNLIQSMNGEYLKVPESLSATPSVQEQSALSTAIGHIGAHRYIWDETEGSIPFGELVITEEKLQSTTGTSGKEESEDKVVLAWKFDIYALEPSGSYSVYVNAHTGDVSWRETTIGNFQIGGSNVIVSAKEISKVNTVANDPIITAVQTARYGQRTIITNRLPNGKFELRDPTRNIDIKIADLTGLVGSQKTKILVNDNNTWLPDDINSIIPGDPYDPTSEDIELENIYALDAMWALASTHDYFKNTYGRNGYDNAQGHLSAFVHNKRNTKINASWRLKGGVKYDDYGDEPHGFTPVTVLDISAHEFTHGVTRTTSDLRYHAESGAVNEAISDIFAAVIEERNLPELEHWLGAEEIQNGPEEENGPVRSMIDPTAHEHPNTYQVGYWVDVNTCDPHDPDYDNCGVHTNSGVMNHWFYILSDGKQSSNMNGDTYDVQGIGMNTAAQIVYQANTYYLTANSGFHDTRMYTIQAAIDSFGINSNEVIQTTNAWYAVGVGVEYGDDCMALNNLNVVVSGNSAVLNWVDPNEGAGTYLIQYRERTPGVTPNWSTQSTSVPNITISNLKEGAEYEVRAKVVCQNTLTSPFVTILITTSSCTAPNLLPPTDITSSGFKIGWDLEPSARSYNVQFRRSGVNNWSTITLGNIGEAIITNLSSATLFEYRVASVCDGIVGNYSEAATVSTLEPAVDCTAPDNLNATNITNDRFTLNWQAVSGASTYQLRYKVKNSSLWVTLNSGNTSLVISGKASGTIYEYQVRALCISSGQYGPYSSTATVITTGSICPTLLNVSVMDIQGTSFTVNWEMVAGASHYVLKVSPTSSSSQLYGQTISVTGNQQTVTGLWPNIEYSYQVKVVCPYGQSEFSPLQIVRTNGSSSCTPLDGMTIETITESEVTLSWVWDKPQDQYILAGRMAGGLWEYVQLPSFTSQYTWSSLNPGTAYEFKISRVCQDGSAGAYSPITSVSTHSAIQSHLAFDRGIDLERALNYPVSIYPNPSDDQVTLSMFLNKKTNISLILTNTQGSEIYSKSFKNVSKGLWRHIIQTNGYSQGIYFVSLSTPESSIVRRLIIQ